MNNKLNIGNNVPKIYHNSINSLERYLNEVNSEIPTNQLDITNTPKWKFESIANWSHISISEKSLNILWCFSLAYFDYYMTICLGVKPQGQEISLKNSNLLNETLNALTWATNNLIETEDNFSQLPEGIRPPKYFETIFPETPEYLFETTLAFYYFHEVGHIEACKKTFNDNISEETFCDDYSIEKLLTNCGRDELKWRKRGIGLGLILMNVIGMHTGFYDGINHPYAYERITDALDKKIARDDDEFWGWIVALFCLHMKENKIKQPAEEFEDFRETVTKYKLLLVAHKNNCA